MTNILLVAFDDLFDVWRYRTSFGITIQTPNLDRLAAKGTRFANAFCPISICGPVRAAVMSNYTPWELGILNNFGFWEKVLRVDQLWPSQLRTKGYYLTSVGKIYHGYSPQALLDGAMYDVDVRDLALEPDTSNYTDRGGDGGGLAFNEGDTEWYDYQCAQDTIDFINGYPTGGRPFYRECGFHHPHSPQNAPAAYFDAIDETLIAPPAAWEAGWDLLQFEADQFVNKDVGAPSTWDADTLDEFQKTIRNYIAAVHYADDQFGRVLDALEASPHNSDTVVVLYSDHGYHLYSHYHYRKFTLWEEACAAPLIVYDPTRTAQVVTEPVSFLDIGPTILDYAGLPVPSEAKGQSLKAVIEGGTAPDRMILSAWFGSVSGRTGDYRVTVYTDGTGSLFDMSTDLWAQNDIKDSDPATYNTLRDELLELAEDWGIKFVSQGVDLSRPTPFAAYLGRVHGTEPIVGRAFVSFGDFEPDLVAPGYNKAWQYPNEDGDVMRMRMGVDAWELATPNGEINDFGIVGTPDGDTFDIADITSGNRVTITGGSGDDIVQQTYATIVAYMGEGADLFGGSRDKSVTVEGGSGDDTLMGSDVGDSIKGGSGADSIDGGDGNDTIIAGRGDDTINTGDGDNDVTLDAGSNTVNCGSGANVIRIYRTGQPQTINDFSGELDLSDWSGLGTVAVTQVGGDVTLTAGFEKITVTSDTATAVAGAVTGAIASVA